MISVADVEEVLRQVLDPELGYNVVDLGLVYEIDVEGNLIRILLTTTTKGCPATVFIRNAVEECASTVSDIAKVEVIMTWDPPWTPERMSDEAKAHFGVTIGSLAARVAGATR